MSWTTHSNYLYRDDIGLFLALLAAARQEIKAAGLTVVEGPSNVIDGNYIIQSQERWPEADHPLPKIEHWFAFPADHPSSAEKQAFLTAIAQYRGVPCPPIPLPNRATPSPPPPGIDQRFNPTRRDGSRLRRVGSSE